MKTSKKEKLFIGLIIIEALIIAFLAFQLSKVSSPIEQAASAAVEVQEAQSAAPASTQAPEKESVPSPSPTPSPTPTPTPTPTPVIYNEPVYQPDPPSQTDSPSNDPPSESYWEYETARDM